jgi:endonuclease/exonuclease/phosphatase family metal-dependent hydrolase
MGRRHPALLVGVSGSLLALAGAAALTLAAAVVPATARPMVSGHQGGTAYSVLQMNLCLSGQADCYSRAAYPSVLDEATAHIVEDDPAAVTLDEVCSGDARTIAARTGYQLRFAAVLVDGAPLRCVDPGDRGRFGIAVLTHEHVTAADDHPFTTQTGAEERRWICATTSGAVTVCTAHLSTRGSTADRRTNDGQCAELGTVLARYAGAGTTVFGGDLNRHTSCAPRSMWATSDGSAVQLPGIQHVYGSTSVDAPQVRVQPAAHTDHDFLLATSFRAPVTTTRSSYAAD